MSQIDMTTSELRERLQSLQARIEGSERASYRSWLAASPERVDLHSERIAVLVELRRRGATPNGACDPGESLAEAIEHAKTWVERRNFAWDREVLGLLEELQAYRRTLHRDALDGDDLVREWCAACPQFPDGMDPFLAGLRRGFDLRAEAKKLS